MLSPKYSPKNLPFTTDSTQNFGVVSVDLLRFRFDGQGFPLDLAGSGRLTCVPSVVAGACVAGFGAASCRISL